MLSRSLHLSRFLIAASANCHYPRSSPCCYVRFLSSSISSENAKIKETDPPRGSEATDPLKAEIPRFTQFFEPTPIQSLNIASSIQTMQKPGSIFMRYFMGAMDTDLLDFPFLLKTRKEFLQMNAQYEMVRNTFNKIEKNDETLNLLGYNSLYKNSISEMMFIFEAIGASIEKEFAFGTREDKEIRYEKKMSKGITLSSQEHGHKISEMAYKCFNNTKSALEAIMPLIVRNALVYYALTRSSNPNLKELMSNPKFKIGFALDEASVRQTSTFSNWNTTALLSQDFQSWFVTGEKNNIVKGDYSHYLVFCRTETFLEQQPFGEGEKNEGIVALLVPASDVEVHDDGSDYSGLAYQKITMNAVKLLRENSEVIKGQKDITELVNIKGCGQLASSAVILGMLKQLLKNTYAHLKHEKLGLANCELIQNKLFQATSKIYAIESMLYMTAAMYDSFEKDTNLENESMTVKTLANEYGTRICQEMRAIFGSRYPFSSTTMEMIYSMDGFLDSTLSNRLLLAQNAMKAFTAYNDLSPHPFAVHVKIPVHRLSMYIKNRKARFGYKMTSNKLTNYTHHNLHSACDWVENCLNRLEYSTFLIANLYKTDVMTKHIDLNKLATLGMDIFMMIAVLSRANHSLCYGIANNHMEKELCEAICKETFLKHLDMFEDMNKDALIDNDHLALALFKENSKENGYFASLFRTPEGDITYQY